MHEKLKISVNNNQAFGTLSKAFFYLSHGLLIAKIHSYGLLLTFLRLQLIICQTTNKELKSFSVNGKH